MKKTKEIVKKIVDFFASCMGPLVPVFILFGLFNSFAVLIGPDFLKIVDSESNLYTNFQYVGNAIAYFMPVMLAYTSSKYFKTNTILSLVLSFILLYPSFIDAIASGSYTMFGIKVKAVSYASSIVPMLLTVALQSYVEKFVRKIIPESLSMTLFPLIVVFIMLPLELCVLGPLGDYLSNLLALGVMWLYNTAGIVETTLVSSVQSFLCAFGINKPIYFVSLDLLLKNGVEYAYLPIAMGTSNFVAMGVSLGYALKTKIKKERQLGFSALISAAIGGVSEPMLFGVLLPHKRAILPVVLSGALGGLALGILKPGYYHMGPSSLFGIISYASDNPTNMVNGIICMAISFVSALVLTVIFYKDEEK